MDIKKLSPSVANKILDVMIKKGVFSYLEIDGTSMEPFIPNGSKLLIDHKDRNFQVGDVVLFEKSGKSGTFLHRIVKIFDKTVITKGDNRFTFDEPISFDLIRGKVIAIVKDGKKEFINEEPWVTFGKVVAYHSYRMGLFYEEMFKEVADEPEMFDKFHQKGVSLYRDGKKKEALECFRTALAYNPSSALSRVDVGEILRQMGKLDEAMVHLRLALEIDKRSSNISAQAYNILGNVWVDMGKIDESFEEYRSAESVDPNFAPLYVNRGWVYFKKGEYEKAKKDLKKALSLEDSFKAHKNLALLYIEMGRYDEAEHHIDVALSKREADADLWNNRGVVFLKRGNWEEAEKFFRKALEFDENHIDALLNIGKVLEKKDRGEALRWYRLLLKRFPNDITVQGRIASLIK